MASAEGGSLAYGAFAAAIELDSEGKAPEWIQLFPRGPKLETVNYDWREWTLSDPQAVADASMEDGLDLPIDWEHAQAIKAAKGERFETAGWIKEIEVRAGVLVGRVEWTAEGRASLESKHYKYFSPGFLSDRGNDGGEVRRVRHGGLVKTPAFKMPALAGAKEGSMLKKILEALGLAADATEAQAVAAVGKLKGDLATAQAAAAAPPPDKFVPMAQYDAMKQRATTAEGKLAEGAAAEGEAEVKRVLDEAQAAGKIVPAARKHYEDWARAEGGLAKVKAFLADQPAIAQPSGLPGSGGPGASAASADEKRVFGALGLTPEFVREHAPKEETG